MSEKNATLSPEVEPQPISGELYDAANRHALEHLHGFMIVLHKALARDDDPRWKHIHALALTAKFLEAIGAANEVAESFNRLAVMLCDLEFGIVDPLLAPVAIAGAHKYHPTLAWQIRMWVALGLECLEKAGIKGASAIQEIRARWPKVLQLAGKPGSTFRAWHYSFMLGGNPSLQKDFQRMYRELDINAPKAPEEHLKSARICFRRVMDLLDKQGD